jgi:peptide/nickel transport system substrate-binding protein
MTPHLKRLALLATIALATGFGSGQVLTVIQTGEPRSLSPNFAADTGAYGPTSNIYSHLVTLDWGVAAGTAAYGDLAESWDVSDDGLTYTFHLYEGVLWHDGEPLTSADVKFTFDTMIERSYPYAAYLRGIVDIATPDDHTVVITLEEPNGAFVPMMAQGSVWTGKIYPRHLWEDQDGFDSGPYVNAPIGSGPFIFREWVRGSHVELEANPNYFRGAPNIDGIVFRVVSDASVARAEFDAGNIVFLPYDYAPPYAEIPLLERDETIQIIHTPSHYSRDIQFNLEREPLGDRDVREAIAMAIDREAISRLAFAGEWEPAYHANVESQTDWFNHDVQFPGFDPEEAERLLDEAGYPRGASGWRFGLSITNPVFADCTAIMEVLVQQLRSVGIEARWDQYDQGTWFTRVQEGDFDITCYFTRYGPDPDAYAEHFETGGPRNFMRYSNPEFDELVARGRTTLAYEERREIYDRIQEILVEDMPYVNLFNESKMSLIRAGWSGFNVQESGYDRSMTWFGYYAVEPPE